MLRAISVAILLVNLPVAGPAFAHYVWLERDGDGPARACLGEWIDDIREKTGGMLDRIKAPKVFLGSSTEALPVKRNDNHLEFQTKGRGDVRLVEDSMPPRSLSRSRSSDHAASAAVIRAAAEKENRPGAFHFVNRSSHISSARE